MYQTVDLTTSSIVLLERILLYDVKSLDYQNPHQQLDDLFQPRKVFEMVDLLDSYGDYKKQLDELNSAKPGIFTPDQAGINLLIDQEKAKELLRQQQVHSH
jgi:hypothetical protein